MKAKYLLSLLLSFSFCLLSSQVPQGLNYQVIARDGSGNPIIGATMQAKIGILSDTIANTMVWEELFNPVYTNAFGMFTLIIGTGVKQSGSASAFSAINWTKTPLFIRTSIYHSSSWNIMGTTKLQSVPYSMVAANLGGKVPQLSVQGNTPTMDSALFVVRNNTGQIVFAVYNEGVRIYVDNGAKGTTKGGFAIGGFGTAKKVSQPLFVVDPDSIRAYIDTGLVKTSKGGFAIGSFNNSKSGIQDYFKVTDDSIRMYINDKATKAVKGGFAIGGFGTSKSGNTHYLRVTHDSTRIITADTIKGFGVGNLSSGNTQGYLLLTPSNYFIGHQAGKNISTGLYNSVLGYEAGYSVNSGTSNSFVGYRTGYYNTSGNFNVFIGNESGLSNTSGSMNTFIGYISGRNNTTGGFNCFVGDSTGYYNSTGTGNTFIGGRVGYNNSTGGYNTFIGSKSGYSNSTGTSNTFVGNKAGYSNLIGLNNVIVGSLAGYLNENGSFNSEFGKYAGYANISGNFNTYIGYMAGMNNSSGMNTFMGYQAGYSNQTGTGNVMIGPGTGMPMNTAGSYNVFIGYHAGLSEIGSNRLYIDNSGNSSSAVLIYGEFDNKILQFNSSVGIGIRPAHLLDLSGGAYTDGSTWTNASDRNLKENFEAIDGKIILELVNNLPLTKWNYKSDKPEIKHIGPVAQDFYSLFGLGNDDKSISSIDPSGVALVAIKELSRQNESMKEEIESARQENMQLRSELDELKTLVSTLVANNAAQGNK